MHHFAYHDGQLRAEDVVIEDIAAAVGTPFYCYSTATLARHFRVFDAALADTDHLICFAVKANSNLAVLATLARMGAGADVVSAGELDRAIAAGIPAERIVYSGVGKSAVEIRQALQAGIHQFNVESEAELELLDSVARALGRRAPVALRINPDVDALTHEKIATGKSDNKFGIPWSRAREAYRAAAVLDGIEVIGVDVHIGSQLTELGPFEAAFSKVAELIAQLRRDGHDIARLDLGGGLGIPYEPGQPAPPPPHEYGEMVRKVAAPLGCELIVEPGRLIAGNAGILVTSILYKKEGESRRFLVVDAAMNDLLRPAMYGAYHDIVPLRQAGKEGREMFDIVGPVCETADIFARDRKMPPLGAGDRVAVLSAGAYGAVMASSYNSRAIVPEVLVNGDQWRIVRDRITVSDLMKYEHIPDWIGKESTDAVMAS